MKGTEFLKTVRSYLIITLGLLLYTIAWTVFIIPNNMVGGGVTGASAIIQYCTGFNVSYSYFIINVVLLLIALKVLGRGFGVKTVFAIAVTTIFLRVLPILIPRDFITEFSENGRLICALIGGAMSGFGVALTFGEGGSSGGTDIIALIINKYRSISPGKVILIIDVVIIASSLIIPSDQGWASRIATVVYGYIIAATFSMVVDVTVSGTKQCVQLFIFSEKYVEIADRISFEAHRGATILHGVGWYTKEERHIVMVVARKNDSPALLNLVKEIDPQAFITMGSVMGVFGKGFERIRK